MILPIDGLRLRKVWDLPVDVRRALNRLKKQQRLLAPARVAVVAIPREKHALALTAFERGRFQIALDQILMDDERQMMEILAHEWAHAVTWDVPDHHDHSDFWGIAYARCYRTVFQTR